VSGPVAVRVAAPDDLAAAAALVVSSYVGGGFVPADSPYVHELEDVQARAREAEVLVAERDGQVVGTVTFCPPGSPWAEISGPGEGEFRMLAVAGDHRRAGVGRLLVASCLDRARQTGSRRVVISTTPRMTAAHRMYERLGFVRLPARDWFPRPDVGLLVYGRDL